MTIPGWIAYLLVVATLIILGFTLRPDFWIGLLVAAVSMISVSLFDLIVARRRGTD